MAKYSDLGESIKQINTTLKKARNNRDNWKNDSLVIELLELAYQTYYSQIHNYLTSLNTESAEKKIRQYVKEVITDMLPLCLDKVNGRGIDLQTKAKYLDIYDNFYALAAFRSLTHFVQYMEFDKDPEKKLWQPTMHLLGGFWYYANSMILNGDVQFILKQCFPGLGKTYSNAFMISFILGYDINAYILYVFGAAANVSSFASGIVDLMSSERYAKVFPYYKQFQGESTDVTKNNIFTICQMKDTGSKLRVSGASFAYNINIVSKDKNTNGLRCQYLFLDDIAQMADAENLTAHTKDKARYTGEWRERRDNAGKFFVVAGGTTYSVDDILTYFKENNNGELAKPTKVNKYTKIADSDFIVHGGKAVFVCIPKLDYETDESTYPAKYKTEDVRRDRDNSLDNGRLFNAMQQQLPLSAEENPFAWDNLNIYECLPTNDLNGGTRNHKCRFVLDPSRKGNDKTVCLFFSQDGDKHYLVDAFADNQPLDHIYRDGTTCLERICRKIIQHQCFEGWAEENTESTIVSQIKNRLKLMNYGGRCDVKGYYSYKVKKDKINSSRTAIQSYLWFPSRRVFGANSDVGRCMTDITYWKYKDNVPDDAPECCANYCEYCIGENSRTYAEFHTFKR